MAAHGHTVTLDSHIGIGQATQGWYAQVKAWLAASDDATLAACRKRYISQMKEAEPARLLDFLAALSHQTNFSVGCYCANPARCHRTVLRELLSERGALIE